MGMGFQFEQHRLGLWDLSWDLKKTISWEMGLGPPPPFTTLNTVIDFLFYMSREILFELPRRYFIWNIITNFHGTKRK